ncbi:isoprenyl transferase-like [Planococcus citri]|uniref:isoprenyl transferase-like n=1 Tax=Planococcus citri TaxID=170843 RepID=UPI0031FA45E2
MWQAVFENLCAKIIKRDKVPRHVAFVADGARRFGKKYNIPVQENHEIGLFGVMWQVIDWCVLLGIREYSILMYSFGNYNRPKDEVQHWVVVLKIWLFKCIMNWKTLEEKGIKFNFYGKLELIPEEINALMGMLYLMTRNNTKCVVNMAMGYTGRHEMSKVAFELYQAIQAGIIEDDHLTEELFTESLFAIENRNVDLLIRTSGYKRISDFLSWQAAGAIQYYSDVLWPEFSTMDFLKAVLYYQMHRKPAKNRDRNFPEQTSNFLTKSKDEKRNYLLKYCFEMGFLPTKDLSEMYSIDNEQLYRCFKIKYNLI